MPAAESCDRMDMTLKINAHPLAKGNLLSSRVVSSHTTDMEQFASSIFTKPEVSHQNTLLPSAKGGCFQYVVLVHVMCCVRTRGGDEFCFFVGESRKKGNVFHIS